MKKFTKLVLGITLLSVALVACKSEKKTETPEASTTEEVTQSSDENKSDEAAVAQVLNANLATEADLKTAGMSDALVATILENRPFLSMSDFNAVLSEENKTEALYAKIFVPFNLNTTAEADFKMIPGVGDRMAHEFEEYRPYVSVEQFKREIGKYVDDAEVARYLNYVFVPVELNTASEEAIKALPGVGDRMAHEFEEYRPYSSMEQFRKEIGKYVDDKELARLERFVYLKE